MILRSLNRGFSLIFCSMMSYFFRCFRVRDDDRNRNLSHSISSNSRECLVAWRGKGIQSLLVAPDGCVEEDKEEKGLETPRRGGSDRQLKDEVKFLKSCGTLLETPIEMQEASEKDKDYVSQHGDSGSGKFHSWLPTTSAKKLLWDAETSPISCKSGILCMEQDFEASSSKHQFIREDRQQEMIHENNGTDKRVEDEVDSETCFTVTPMVAKVLTTQQCKNKSVRFDCKPDRMYSLLEKSYSLGSNNLSKYSPYPTPFKITDEMQTPGTVYPANLQSSTRIRSQYIYPALNPVLNLPKWKVLKEEDFKTREQFDNLIENISPNYTSISEINNLATNAVKEVDVGNEINLDANLLETTVFSENDNVKNLGKTPMEGSRLIFGTVAAYWNGDEYPSNISPKWWVGNGIPNSTNKYKEDQKVSWHATPFEERLEKALTDETLVYRRRVIPGRPIDFDDKESDKADSRL